MLTQGMLGIGAVMLGSEYVCGVDVDADALAQACTNASQFEDVAECMDWLQADVRQLAVGTQAGCVFFSGLFSHWILVAYHPEKHDWWLKQEVWASTL